MDESQAGSVAMTGTLPHRERNGQPRDHLTLAAGQTKNEPWGDRPEATVVGGGIAGVMTALSLLRKGCRVTLVDRWEPGHAG